MIGRKAGGVRRAAFRQRVLRNPKSQVRGLASVFGLGWASTGLRIDEKSGNGWDGMGVGRNGKEEKRREGSIKANK